MWRRRTRENTGSETPVDTDEETSDENGEETSSTSSNPNASPEMDFDLGGRTLTFRFVVGYDDSGRQPGQYSEKGES